MFSVDRRVARRSKRRVGVASRAGSRAYDLNAREREEIREEREEKSLKNTLISAHEADTPKDTQKAAYGDAKGSQGEAIDQGEGDAALPTRGARYVIARTVAARTVQLEEGDFGRWWAAWPRKEARKEALKAWRALSRAGRLPGVDELIAAVAAQAAALDWRPERRRYIPHPATWLRGERWADEVAGARREAVLERPQGIAKAFEPTPELIALARRGRAIKRVMDALRDHVVPDEADMALMLPDTLEREIRRAGWDPRGAAGPSGEEEFIGPLASPAFAYTEPAFGGDHAS